MSDATASETDLARLIQTDPRAWRVFLFGFQWGYIEGAAAQRLSDEDLAEFASRVAVANAEVQEDVRETARRAREWIDVQEAREATRKRAENSATGSAYVPVRRSA